MKPAVLIVEDDSKTAELIRLYLDRDGYPVTVARNGREGLELARRNNLGPVLLDVMMPELARSSPRARATSASTNGWSSSQRSPSPR